MILILDLCLYTGSLGCYLVDLFKNLALDNPKGYMFTSGQQRKEFQEELVNFYRCSPILSTCRILLCSKNGNQKIFALFDLYVTGYNSSYFSTKFSIVFVVPVKRSPSTFTRPRNNSF